ncbi:hypothetical protein C0991_011474, partial [Blastosporella zonata]
MVNAIYDGERHLLTDSEIYLLIAFLKLPYEARFCLSLTREVGEDGLDDAISALCRPIGSDIKQETKEEPGLEDLMVPEVEVINLVSDDEDETKPEVSNAEAGPSSCSMEQDIKPTLDKLLQSRPYEPDFTFFLEDESSMSLDDALRRLNRDQLLELAKDTKTNVPKNFKACIQPYPGATFADKLPRIQKDSIVTTLIQYAFTQQPLDFQKSGRSRKSGKDGFKQTQLPFFKVKAKVPQQETQEHRLIQMTIAKLDSRTTGRSVRVNVDLYWLVVRLNIIYARATEYPKTLLVDSLLTSFKKRTYPQYTYSRNNTIWSTREELMDYVEALRLESAIEAELDTTPGQPPTRTSAVFVTPAPPGVRRGMTTTCRTPMSAGRVATESPAVKKKDPDREDEVPEDSEKSEKKEVGQRVKRAFDEVVCPKWKQLVKLKQGEDARERAAGLERFESGFVYTRIFGKAMEAMATLKQHSEEHAALTLLLGQTFWRQGNRARWYDRRALLQTNYLCFRSDSQDNKTRDLNVLHEAMEGIREALNDDATHLVRRPGLVRRLERLEKQLNVPQEDRVYCSAKLRDAEKKFFSAERITKTDKSLEVDANGRLINKSATKDVRSYFSPHPNATNATAEDTSKDAEKPPPKKASDTWKRKGKSIWRGRNGEQVNVESRALQYYEDLGYKGFHSETRILTTLFALLFWDIIFADVPGAFETAHQIEPLDLMEDSFYRARKDLIEARLKEMKQESRARDIVQRHDDLHRAKNTWCVGVRWDICSKEDLLEIVECLGGEPLAIICRLFCEDYRGRRSGVPDLIVWNSTKGLCKFVEVKGPGDSASDNQRLWFDSLLVAGASVEVCHVLDQAAPPKVPKPSTAKKTKRGSAKSKGKGKARADSDVEIDYDLLGLEHQYDEPYGSPLNLKKRKHPLDENADVLPTFPSSETPPTTPYNLPAMRRLNNAEVVPKKRRLALSS